MFKELEVVRLKVDIPEHSLKVGETGTIVLVLSEGEAYEVEFVNADGTTKALAVLKADQIELVSSKTPGTASALFWSCRSKPDDILRHASVRLRQEEFEFAEGTNLVERCFDAAKGLFSDGKVLRITDWRDAAEFAEHWDGMVVSFARGLGNVQLEILRVGSEAPHLMLHVADGLFRGHQKSAERATRWTGLLMDLYDSCGAESCHYSVSLRDVPSSEWGGLVSGKEARPAFRIAVVEGGEPVPEGFKSISLTSGATLVTSLPVKSSPHG